MAAKVPQQKIADCRELYLRYGGEAHERIASRCVGVVGEGLRNAIFTPAPAAALSQGWPERFGWDGDLP
ncbi:MAG: hypothetical protein IPP63_15630 [Chloracidobacterium sp.]|nr:hypothetical protein [Chloracidobacterium sp.]